VLGLPHQGTFLVVSAETRQAADEPLPRVEIALRSREVGSVWRLEADRQVGILSLPRESAVVPRFTPGARTAWHTHPNGQTIFVVEGVGRAQRRGGPVEEIRPGDRVFFEPGEEHWHGAAPDRFMTHIAMLDVDDEGRNADWGEHVTDEEYGAA